MRNGSNQYNAADLEVLRGLEPVKRRPGMYTDTTRPNHLAQEVIDNAVDEAIASENGTQNHHNEYALPMDDINTGLLLDNSSLLPVDGRHPNNCIADFMRTSWSSRGNLYGDTLFSDVRLGLLGYAQFRNPGGYTMTSNSVAGMSWSAYWTQINAGRPVVLLVDSDGDAEADRHLGQRLFRARRNHHPLDRLARELNRNADAIAALDGTAGTDQVRDRLLGLEDHDPRVLRPLQGQGGHGPGHPGIREGRDG